MERISLFRQSSMSEAQSWFAPLGGEQKLQTQLGHAPLHLHRNGAPQQCFRSSQQHAVVVGQHRGLWIFGSLKLQQVACSPQGVPSQIET
jgi:hypothetical protein